MHGIVELAYGYDAVREIYQGGLSSWCTGVPIHHCKAKPDPVSRYKLATYSTDVGSRDLH